MTAILIVAVAAAAAALMLTQQASMLDQTSMVMARAQADAFAQAGVDWARGVLLDDLRRAPAIDSLDEPWAQPIPALPVERAVVSGALTDEQGKFNLNALALPQPHGGEATRIFRDLLGTLGLQPELAAAVTDWIDADPDLTPNGAEDAYYLSLPKPYRAANVPMVQVEELYRVRGFDADTVAKLKPYVTALPAPATGSPINVNTASDVVLAAVAAITREEAARVMARRTTKPFASRADFAAAVSATTGRPATSIPNDLDVRSSFYSVRIQVAQDDVRLAAEALLQRDPKGTVAVVWRRPRY